MTSRQHQRKVCNKCGQELSHSAWSRHQNPAVCLGADRSLQTNQSMVDKATVPTELPEMETDHGQAIVDKIHDGVDSSESCRRAYYWNHL